MLRVVLEQLPERPVKLQESKVEIEARTQPHDVCRVLELPGGSPLLLQGGDAAAEEVRANSADSEPGKPEAQDPGDSNLQLGVVRSHVAPIAAAHHWSSAHGSEWLRLLLNDQAPVRSPLLPSAVEFPLQVSLLLASLGDPGDPAG